MSFEQWGPPASLVDTWRSYGRGRGVMQHHDEDTIDTTRCTNEEA